MEKYVKKFKGFVNEMKIEDDDLLSKFSSFDKFRHWMINHPSYEDNDLLAVYVGDKFEEQEDGSYQKNYELLTNIMKITPDKGSFTNANMMKFRGKHQDAEGTMVLQWVDKDISDDMIDKIKAGGEEGDFMLKTLVNHFKEHSQKRRGR